MNKYIGIYFIFLLVNISNSFAQGISFRFQAGYNMHNMAQLKKMQMGLAESISDETGIPVKVVDDFPSFYNFQVQFLVTTPELFSTGMYIDYCSTGGRIHYKDYSGEYGFDQILTQMTIGGIIEKNLFGFAQAHYFSVIFKRFYIKKYLEK